MSGSTVIVIKSKTVSSFSVLLLILKTNYHTKSSNFKKLLLKFTILSAE